MGQSQAIYARVNVVIHELGRTATATFACGRSAEVLQASPLTCERWVPAFAPQSDMNRFLLFWYLVISYEVAFVLTAFNHLWSLDGPVLFAT